MSLVEQIVIGVTISGIIGIILGVIFHNKGSKIIDEIKELQEKQTKIVDEIHKLQKNIKKF